MHGEKVKIVVKVGEIIMKLGVVCIVGLFVLCKAGRRGGRINGIWYVAGIIVVL
jgi:hypothetical protein